MFPAFWMHLKNENDKMMSKMQTTLDQTPFKLFLENKSDYFALQHKVTFITFSFFQCPFLTLSFRESVSLSVSACRQGSTCRALWLTSKSIWQISQIFFKTWRKKCEYFSPGCLNICSDSLSLLSISLRRTRQQYSRLHSVVRSIVTPWEWAMKTGVSLENGQDWQICRSVTSEALHLEKQLV